MMKKHEIFFSVLKLPVDFCIVIVSFFLAVQIRMTTDLIPGIQLPTQTILASDIIGLSILGAFLYIGLFMSHGLYTLQIHHSKIKECMDIIRYGIYWFCFYALFLFLGKDYLYEDIEIPRLVILFSFLLATTLSILSRIILNNIQYSLLSSGVIEKRNIILINNQSSKDIQHIIDDIQRANIYNTLGYINTKEIPECSLKYLGNSQDLVNLLEQKHIDEILYIDSDLSKKQHRDIWDISRIFAVKYRYLTNQLDITQTNTSLSLIHGIATLEMRNTSLDMWGRVMKRCIDTFVSALLLILLFPLLLILFLIIKFSDISAPAIYKNTRVGQNGKPFTLYKFRYMKWEYCTKESYGIPNELDDAIKKEADLIAEKSSRDGPLYKIKNDPRKTTFGSFIEKYSLDELPQLFNVLIGNMSFVGPRPHQPREVKKYSFHQKRLLTIKPGVTGMAQVNGREKNSFDDEAKLDIFYIENWSILLDIKIFFKTLPLVFNRK